MEKSLHNIATPWRFRDGTEYLVSMTVSLDQGAISGGQDKCKSISLVLANKITAEEWSGEFDAKYIENLTQRTGNYKPFHTFLAMLKSALLKKSDAVALDLMSYEDLLTLKSQKTRQGQASASTINDFILAPNLSKFENSDLDVNQQQSQSQAAGPKSKKYIIITYVAEFDKVHYPLPLKYTGYPDASVMQQTIHRLQAEVDQLKSTNTELLSYLKAFLKSTGAKPPPTINIDQGHNINLDQNLNCTDDSDSFSEPECRDVKNMCRAPCRKESSIDNVQNFQSLASLVERLEVQIEGERISHKGKMSSLEKENNYLRDKLRSIENSESILKDKVVRLESVLAMNVGLKTQASNVKEVYRSRHVTRGKQEPELYRTDSFRTLSNPLSRINDHSGHSYDTRIVNNGRRGKGNSSLSGSRNNSSSRSRDSSVATGCIFNNNKKKKCDRELIANALRERGTNPSRSSSKSPVTRVVSAASRSHSQDTKSVFDPTEYVKQKKIRQERMAQLRMAQVEQRILKRGSNSKFQDEDQMNNPSLKIHESPEKASSVERKRTALIRFNTAFADKAIMGQNHDPGKNIRSMSTESHRSLQRTGIPFVQVRQMSPSPPRPRNTKTGEHVERQSRKKTRDIRKNNNNNMNNNNQIGQMAIQEILDGARKHYNRKAEAKQARGKLLLNANKSKSRSSQRFGKQGSTNTDASLEGLKRRLLTIHAFLGKNQKSEG